MFLRLRYVAALAATTGLVGCGAFGGKEDAVDWGDVPTELKSGGQRGGGPTPVEQGSVAAGVDPASLKVGEGGVAGLPSEEDIIWTDPDAIEESEASIKGLFKAQKKDWLLSHSMAKNYSAMDGKPLLILFTDMPGPKSNGSPAAVKLDRELLARTDFSDWAAEKFIRLKLDYNIRDLKAADPEKQSEARRKDKFLKSLKERYKVFGYPSILVVAPDGSVVHRIRGYSGNPEYTWGLLRTAAEIAETKQFELESKLLKKGYRHWQGQNEQKMIARLVSYHEGDLILVGPNGNRFKTSEKNLSESDREWLKKAKMKSEKKRNLRP